MQKQYSATNNLSESRMKICNRCEHLSNKLVLKQCRLCGCFIVAKTKLLGEKCPLSKW